MSRSIKTLPILERWDCHSCGNCCRGSVIPLNDDDLAKLRGQNWAARDDFRGIDPVVSWGWRRKQHQLLQRPDGSCIFLSDGNFCRIHQEYGADAKPLACRMFPLQWVPHQDHVVLTLRRSCPSAAAEEGRTLDEHRRPAQRIAREGPWLDKQIRAPAVSIRYEGSWSEWRRITGALGELLTDERFPLVRRLAHGVRFCELVDQCRFGRLDAGKLKELMPIIQEGARDESSDFFRERESPPPAVRALFRQVAAEYLRLHSQHRAAESWRERWRLSRVAYAMTRGAGQLPEIVAGLPQPAFEDLEQPLGPLEEAVQQPLLRFYEANALSLQYAIAVRPGWPLTESFRATALGYPIALWLLRWLSYGREPSAEDTVELVTIIDRGQGHASLISRHHRRRVRLLSADGGLSRLLAWYAR